MKTKEGVIKLPNFKNQFTIDTNYTQESLDDKGAP